MKPLPEALAELMKERHLTQTALWAAADLSPYDKKPPRLSKRGGCRNLF